MACIQVTYLYAIMSTRHCHTSPPIRRLHPRPRELSFVYVPANALDSWLPLVNGFRSRSSPNHLQQILIPLSNVFVQWLLEL